MKNQLEFENYILRNGTNVTNEKLQALMFFSLICLYRSLVIKKLNCSVIVKNDCAIIIGTSERYQKYGNEVIPVPNEELHLSINHEMELDAILNTYDQFEGEQLTQIIRETGLLDNCHDGYLNMKDYFIYYLHLIRNNLKINRTEKIYQSQYFTKFKISRWIYFILAMPIFLAAFIHLNKTLFLPAFLLIFAVTNLFNLTFPSYSDKVNNCISFVVAMRVEKYKLEKLKLEGKI